MNKRTLTHVAAAASLTAGLAVAMTGPALAQGGGGGTSSGTCSVVSTSWQLKAQPQDAMTELEAEVHTGVPGQVWNWTLKSNGKVAATGTSTTTGDDNASFKVMRLVGKSPLASSAARNKVTFNAFLPANGETCQGSLTF
jgi:hypothetical protein